MNMNTAQKTKFDLDIAPQELRELMIDRQNAEQMKLLQGDGPRVKPVPLAHRRRRSE